MPRAPIFRPRREPAQPAGETPTGEQFVTNGMTVDSSAPPQNASVRTIILGIDHSGRIVQHDRNAPTVLGRPAEKLVGSSLSDLLLDPSPADDSEAKSAERKSAGHQAQRTKGTQEGEIHGDRAAARHPRRRRGAATPRRAQGRPRGYR